MAQKRRQQRWPDCREGSSPSRERLSRLQPSWSQEFHKKTGLQCGTSSWSSRSRQGVPSEPREKLESQSELSCPRAPRAKVPTEIGCDCEEVCPPSQEAQAHAPASPHRHSGSFSNIGRPHREDSAY